MTGNITLSADDVGAAKKDHIHSNYVNQKAFSNVKVGSTTIAAETTTDTLEIAAGTGISVSPDATNDKVTITNSGVRSISTGGVNGTISVNTNGEKANIAVKGLGSAAYTNSDAYDAKDSAKNAKAEAIAKAKEYTDGEIQSLIGAAPETLDTLGELAAAFKDNKNVVDALNEAITNKVDNDHLTASNPHGITKTTVGLSNVENKSVATIKSEILTSENIENTLGYMPPAPYRIATSDTLGLVKSGDDITINATTGEMSVKNDSHTHTLSKISDFPVKKDELRKLSGLTVDSAKINLLADADSNIQAQLNDKSNNNHDHNDATASTHGFMSTADKTKLNNISDNANKVEFSQIIKKGDSGAVAIGDITIDGTSHKIYGKIP